MPTHASTAKRMRSDKKRRLRNRMVKSQVRSSEKKVRQAKNRDQALEELARVTSLLDKAASKRVVHSRTADRKKSKLAKSVNAMKTESAAKPAAKKK
jgi:small subunit ribosomal protein S20